MVGKLRWQGRGRGLDLPKYKDCIPGTNVQHRCAGEKVRTSTSARRSAPWARRRPVSSSPRRSAREGSPPAGARSGPHRRCYRRFRVSRAPYLVEPTPQLSRNLLRWVGQARMLHRAQPLPRPCGHAALQVCLKREPGWWASHVRTTSFPVAPIGFQFGDVRRRCFCRTGRFPAFGT